MRRLIPVGLLLALVASGCAYRSPTLDNPPHGSFEVVVVSTDAAAKTSSIRYSDETTDTAMNLRFPKMPSGVTAFVDMGPDPDGAVDIGRPFIVWYLNGEKDGYTYDPEYAQQSR